MIQTYSGKMFDILNPEPSNICIEDIFHALSNVCRFTGHSTPFYSVADHCVNVCKYLRDRGKKETKQSRELLLFGLLHDASEAYIGDVSTPLKILLPTYKMIEGRIQEAIFFKFVGRLPTSSEENVIKLADTRMLIIEKNILFEHKIKWDVEYGFDMSQKSLNEETIFNPQSTFLDYYLKLAGD